MLKPVISLDSNETFVDTVDTKSSGTKEKSDVHYNVYSEKSFIETSFDPRVWVYNL